MMRRAQNQKTGLVERTFYQVPLWLAIVVAITATARVVVAQPAPPAPLWDEVFRFSAAVVDDSNASLAMTEYHYRWDIPAVSQVLTDGYGRTFIILHVKTHTWRVTPGNRTCCLCTNPYACGNVLPPAPDWLRRGNETQYLGITAINERDCYGWAKANEVAKFGWWVSVKTGVPCQLSWLLGVASNMVMSYYTNDPAQVPKELFDIPSYCPFHETDPNCSISGF